MAKPFHVPAVCCYYYYYYYYYCVCDQVQFVAGMTHAAQSLYIRCPYPLWMQWALIFYGGTILALFINFYFQSYVRPTRPATQVAASAVQPLAVFYVNNK